MKSLSHWRDEQFADLTLAIVGLVAHKHPEDLRKCLGMVFDLKAVEHSTTDIRTKLANLWTTYEEFRAKLVEMDRDIDRKTLALEKLEVALAKARANWGQLVARGAKK